MRQYKIAFVIGSIRKNSLNRMLAESLQKFAPEDFSFTFLSIDSLPLYNQDDDANPSEAATKLKADIRAADGVIFITPEYNRSVPGVLKNALDHASRPYGDSAWKAKPAGVLGVSIGSTGTSMAQQHLRNILSYLEMPTLTQPEAFIHIKSEATASVDTIGEDFKGLLQKWMNAYVNWVKKHTD